MKLCWNPLRAILAGIVRAYQVFVSPMLPSSCKYYPSCSQYALDALNQFGVFRGAILAGWRLLRCNPLSHGGYDPVERQKLFASHNAVDGARTDRDQRANPPLRSGGPTVGREARC